MKVQAAAELQQSQNSQQQIVYSLSFETKQHWQTIQATLMLLTCLPAAAKSHVYILWLYAAPAKALPIGGLYGSCASLSGCMQSAASGLHILHH
jgi:hypothetical protein